MFKKLLIFSGLLIIFFIVSIYLHYHLQQMAPESTRPSGKDLICGMNPKDQKNNMNIKWVKPKEEEQINTISDKSKCSADKKVCQIRIGPSRWISLELLPRPITSRKKVQFLVKVSDKALIPTKIDIVGLSLNMGYLRPSLEKINDLNYQLDFILPFCEEEKMQWAATVHYQARMARTKMTQGVQFYFESLK